MDSKSLIVQILTKLQWHRALADGILALVQSVDMQSKTYDALLKILHHAYKTAANNDERHHLQKSVELIQRIHQKEQAEKALSEEDVAHLLDEINNA